jgi:hypothetical protein
MGRENKLPIFHSVVKRRQCFFPQRYGARDIKITEWVCLYLSLSAPFSADAGRSIMCTFFAQTLARSSCWREYFALGYCPCSCAPWECTRLCSRQLCDGCRPGSLSPSRAINLFANAEMALGARESHLRNATIFSAEIPQLIQYCDSVDCCM